jgi:predicted dehydrogenase
MRRKLTMAMGLPKVLRIGFIGSGFIASFHLQAFESVRNATISGVYSPTKQNRERLAAQANERRLGPCRAYASLEEMLASGEVDAVWLLGPNDLRLAHMSAVHAAAVSGATPLVGIACEKPLARTLGEADEMVRLVKESGLMHGYLENQVFYPAVRRAHEVLWRRAVPVAGRPYLVRAAEEHAGPHSPWFWDAERQGGGVLLDMMCHSVEAARFLLSRPGDRRDVLRPVAVQANIDILKWRRQARALAARGDSRFSSDQKVGEDYAHGVVTFEDGEGNRALAEVSTSWAYVGPGLRISIEVQGPEYAAELNSLATSLHLFLSRSIASAQGEDLIEKQSAEQGLMPVIDDEAFTYGYVAEDRHMVDAFLANRMPDETFHDGRAVVELLMALYKSAAEGRRISLPDPGLVEFAPSFT